MCGLIGTMLSVFIRIELSDIGVGVLEGNHQVFNVIIAHAFLMIFLWLCLH